LRSDSIPKRTLAIEMKRALSLGIALERIAGI